MGKRISEIKKILGIENSTPTTSEEINQQIDKIVTTYDTMASQVASSDYYSSMINSSGGGAAGNVMITSGANVIPGSYIYNAGGNSMLQAGNISSSWFNYTIPKPDCVVSFKDDRGVEIVRLNFDGTVEWANPEFGTTEAAKAFAATIKYSAELKAGINEAVKLKMRDSVFNDLIEIAKQKGSLTADDLTYLLEASKIVERLKGINE